MKKGRFITVEGVEGVGKSTNIDWIESILKARKIPYISTREPGGTDLAEKIRLLLLDKNENLMVDKTELMLVFAARSQHVAELIVPALESGSWVVCDRFTDSSYAYQGYGRGLDLDLIKSLERLAIDCFSPDLTFILDLPVEIGMQRARQRAELDRIEQEGVDFFNRVRQGFLQRADEFDRCCVIDANQSLSRVQQQISNLLMAQIEKWAE
ncbi:MAG: dTMP kinase [Pseudomonadales bacterium]|nr:dTMP kinase [Pseudomonadales bacterium]